MKRESQNREERKKYELKSKKKLEDHALKRNIQDEREGKRRRGENI